MGLSAGVAHACSRDYPLLVIHQSGIPQEQDGLHALLLFVTAKIALFLFAGRRAASVEGVDMFMKTRQRQAFLSNKVDGEF